MGAILFAKKGVNVVICSRKEDEIENTVKVIKGMHCGGVGHVIGLVCDVRISSQVDDPSKKSADVLSRIDILINIF